MGFLGDISKIRKQTKELEKTFDTYDVKDEATQAIESVKAINETLANQTAALKAASASTGSPFDDGYEATAQVVSVGSAFGSLGMDMLLPVELLVMEEGLPPRPMKVSVPVPGPQLHRMVPGSTLMVMLSHSKRDALAVDWPK